MNEDDVRARLAAWLQSRELCMSGDAAGDESDGTVYDRGVLDSLGLLRLVLFVESTFNVNVPDDDVVPEHFATLDALTEYVARRLGER